MTRWMVAALVAAAVPATAAAQAAPDVEIQWGVKIPLRDGTKLNATIYRPRGAVEKLPVIFTLTPYIADSYYRWGLYHARDRYIYAAVDVRGRGNSEGQFEPFVNEAKDGYDVVEWFGTQPWSSGKVAMWGGSYGGTDQWATLKEMPPHLTTVVPVAPAYLGIDFPFEGNIYSTYLPQWLTFTGGKTAQAQLFADHAQWTSYVRILAREKLPFRALDSIGGNRSWLFQKWLDHPTPDAYWDQVSPTPAQYAKMTQPVLTITGHYDGDQLGTLEHYRNFRRYATAAERQNIWLVIGPWDHGGTRVPTKEVNGVVFGDNSMVDIQGLHKNWYDWAMKGSGVFPPFLKNHVAYYVAGSNGDVWRYADSLEVIAKETRRFHLASPDGRANDAFGGGRLDQNPPAGAPSDQYVYDPTKPPAVDVEATHPSARSFIDQEQVLTTGGNGVVYTSAPFAEETEIAGQVSLTVWATLDVPDTDFQALLYELLPDGRAIMLTTSILRARYRESLREGKPVPVGVPQAYRFTRFPWFARRLAKGSRLRLFFRSPSGYDLERNYNSGGVVANETTRDARTAHVTILHDRDHQSVLEVPIR